MRRVNDELSNVFFTLKCEGSSAQRDDVFMRTTIARWGAVHESHPPNGEQKTDDRTAPHYCVVMKKIASKRSKINSMSFLKAFALNFLFITKCADSEKISFC